MSVRRYGLIRRLDGEFQLCSPDADIPEKRIVWVEEDFAVRQGSLFAQYHDYQTILGDRWRLSRPIVSPYPETPSDSHNE